MNLKEIEKVFRIELVVGENVSEEAIRQFARVVTNIVEGKKIYKMTSPEEKVTYHATMTDIARHLISKGIINAQTQNIQMAYQLGSRAYAHSIESVIIERE